MKDGTYFRKGDSRIIQRFRCRHCGKRFSKATNSLLFRQRKRRVHTPLKRLLASGNSMRRSAKLLGIDKKTVARKLVLLAKLARLSQANFLKKLQSNPVIFLQVDDLITFEHTKLKPLTVSLAVDKKTRAILGAEVGQIPAFGHLAELSRQKYGKRKSLHRQTFTRLCSLIQDSIGKFAVIESDEHPLYPDILKSFFPEATHIRYKGGRGCIVGQGELKKKRWDPLFGINHSCAMIRENINRLIRRTWSTTKDPQMLKLHLDIFIDYYNREHLALG